MSSDCPVAIIFISAVHKSGSFPKRIFVAPAATTFWEDGINATRRSPGAKKPSCRSNSGGNSVLLYVFLVCVLGHIALKGYSKKELTC